MQCIILQIKIWRENNLSSVVISPLYNSSKNSVQKIIFHLQFLSLLRQNLRFILMIMYFCKINQKTHHPIVSKKSKATYFLLLKFSSNLKGTVCIYLSFYSAAKQKININITLAGLFMNTIQNKMENAFVLTFFG